MLAAALAMTAGLIMSEPAQAQSAARLPAQATNPTRHVVGPEGGAQALAQAVQAARDGDIIELMPGEYRGALVLAQRRLTLRGVGEQPALIRGPGGSRDGSEGGEGREGPEGADAAPALWLMQGGDITLENLEFRGARSANGSGAGVRQEGGRLTLKRCLFFDNEHGVLAMNDAQAELHIDSSVFGLAPRVVGGLHHLLNVGRIAHLSITGSRFQQGFEGHMIKSRARRTEIRYNFIHDSSSGGASYEIEIAGGGVATVVGNVIGQGANTQNPVVLAYGTEGGHWSDNRLELAHNTFIHYGWLPGWFVRVFSDRLPADTPVVVVNNLFVGPGLYGSFATTHSAGNRPAALAMLRDAETYAFELPAGSIWRGSGVDPQGWAEGALVPRAEFKWPVGIEPLAEGRQSWSPGAYQR